MQEASVTSAAESGPHNNNLTTKSDLQKITNSTTKNHKKNFVPHPGNSKTGSNRFELETDNDNWPDVDLGNLITDLDADIIMSNASSNSSSGGSGSVPAGASLNMPSGGGTTTATLTEQVPAINDKSLKMKIKRNKTGSKGSTEGKLEIVPQESADGTNGSPTDPIGLSAAEIVAAVKQNSKPAGSSPALSTGAGKVRLTSTTTGTVSTPVTKKTTLTTPGIGSIVTPAKSTPEKPNGTLTNSSGASTVGKPQYAAPNAPPNGPGYAVNPNATAVADSKVGNSASNKLPAHGNNRQSSTSEPPAKKQKIDASVGTEMGTMTEPECLGPLDPGTSVTLEGIVWHETDGGVLVINVTWRGKTYVGTLLDSSRHVNQWAPPRYSDSPTSEIDGRTPKGRGKRSRGAGTPVETETRKNLRSSKVSCKSGRSNLSQANSPAKRKGRNGEAGDEKRARTDSSRNSPFEDEGDSEREQNKDRDNTESDRESTASSKVKEEKDEDFTPKDKEDEKYVPPPPLPFVLVCPKPDCNKKYRHDNGLRYHVSHAHPELMDKQGEIKAAEEIERMENEAKLKEEAQAESGGENLPPSVPVQLTTASEPTKTAGPALTSQDGKPVEGFGSNNIKPQAYPPQQTYKSPSTLKTIRPPSNARPIVPATGPQVMAGGVPLGPAGINLKPIQPRPTIMPEPIPNLSFDELRKSKKDFKKKKDSPANSPPRNGATSNINGASPKSAKPDGLGPSSQDKTDAKSPAYSDISDDNEDGEKRRSETKPTLGGLPGVPQGMGIPPSTSAGAQAPPAHVPFSPYSKPVLPNSVPVTKPDPGSPKLPKKEIVNTTGPQPGTLEYEKMLQAYGFPPFPYPVPQGMDPTMHVHLLNSDPHYRSKYELERSEKERQFKEQIDRDNREKDRRAGVKFPEDQVRAAEDLRKQMDGARTPTASPRMAAHSGTISVKPEFRVDTKQEPKDQKPIVTSADEGVKPTMETRGPPPSTPSSTYNYLPGLFRPPGVPYEQLFPPGLLNLPGYAGNPYFSPHLAASGFRPPFPIPGSLPEDLSRAAGTSATKALDLLHQHATQYYAAAVAAASSASSTSAVSAGMGSPHNAHKIHELQDRALKSPSSGKSSPAPLQSSMTTLTTGTTVTSATTTKSAADLSSASRSKDVPSPSVTSRLTPTSRGRSPPPLRHVHTHTHTHYGLGYPLLPPPPGSVPSLSGVGAPPAHSGFPATGFPASLLPGKPPIPGSLPNFPPPK